MEGLQVVHYSKLVSEGSGFDLNLRTLNCAKSCVKDEQSTCNNMIENIENTLCQDCSCYSVLNKENSIDEEVGVDKILCFQKSHFTGCNWTSEQEKTSTIEEIPVCKEVIPLDTSLKNCLRKSATFPSSEVESPLLLYLERNATSTSTISPIWNSFGDQHHTYKRSTSLPATSMLISAMKGGRAQVGTMRTDMRVKWAAEVYDPPSTLMSHTVKNPHHQRPKSSKKDKYKNKKHNKGKNSRGNSNGKKLSNPGNACSLPIPIPAKHDPASPWLQTGGASGSAQSVSGEKPGVEILEPMAGSIQEVKCGNHIFLRQSLARLHLSFGEAT